MKLNLERKLALSVFFICSPTLAQAGMMQGLSEASNQHLEISTAIGPNWFNTQNTDLVISAFETDSIHQNSGSNGGAWKAGVGYYLNAPPHARTFLNQLLLELNAYQITGTMQGNVFQYGLAQFNNYTFQAPFTSTRLMLDAKPSLFNGKDFSAYFIGGIGIAWNEISYNEFTKLGMPQNSALSLPNQTSSQFAYEIGAGVSLKLTKHLSATAEYVSAFLGSVSPKNDPNGVDLMKSPRFSLKTQSLLFGLSLTF